VGARRSRPVGNYRGDVHDAHRVEQVGDGVPVSAKAYMGR
jgi:hypothetical protein